MRGQLFWFLFVAAFAATTLGFSAYAGLHIYRYARLSAKAPVQAVEWKIAKLGTDAYSLRAQYSFTDLGQQQEGEAVLSGMHCRSWVGAEAALQRAKEADWTVWYVPNAPQNSSLERVFPWKMCCYAGLLILTFGYMLLMSWIVVRRSQASS